MESTPAPTTKQERYRRKKGQKERYLPDSAVAEMIEPPRMTAKQAKFAEALASGLSHGEARKHVGISSTSAHFALKNPTVQQYLSAIRSESRAIAQYDAVQAMDDADEAAQFAKDNKNPMALVKARELKMKLAGLLIDRVEVFTADLKGAMELAKTRVIGVSHTPQLGVLPSTPSTSCNTDLPSTPTTASDPH